MPVSAETVAAVHAGDEATFGQLLEPHRRELQVHCYRMVGSLEDSEDLVQETFLRAWRHRRTFAGRASLRAWLYRIATNACLDALERRPRAEAQEQTRPLAAVPWLQPYPDRLLDELPSADDEPETPFSKLQSQSKRLSSERVRTVLESLLFVADKPLTVDQQECHIRTHQ